VIKYRRMGWARNVAFMAEKRGSCRVWWGNLRGKRQFKRYRSGWKGKVK